MIITMFAFSMIIIKDFTAKWQESSILYNYYKVCFQCYNNERFYRKAIYLTQKVYTTDIFDNLI